MENRKYNLLVFRIVLFVEKYFIQDTNQSFYEKIGINTKWYKNPPVLVSLHVYLYD